MPGVRVLDLSPRVKGLCPWASGIFSLVFSVFGSMADTKSLEHGGVDTDADIAICLYICLYIYMYTYTVDSNKLEHPGTPSSPK